VAESLTWIAGDSSTYVLYSDTASDRGIVSIEGFGLPTLEHVSQPFPFLHGALDIARRFRDRVVQIGFEQEFSNRANWQAGRQALAAALNPELGMGQLKFIDASANDWRLDAWVVNAPLPRQADFPAYGIRTVLEFWVPWPFWRKASQESVNADFNGTTPVNIAVSNDGNMPTVPSTIVLAAGVGETIINPVLTIVGTGKTIDLAHTVAAGETVTITCFPPDVAAITKGGVSIIGDLTYNSVLVGFELPRGNSTVQIVGDAGSNGNCQINFYEWFLAV